MLGAQAFHSKGGGPSRPAALLERLKRLLRRSHQDVDAVEEPAADGPTAPEADSNDQMASSVAEYPSNELGWAVAESIEWLAQQVRAADGLPPGSGELLRVLENPTLRAAAGALEQLAELAPRCNQHQAAYGRLCAALDTAARAFGAVQTGGRFEKRRQRRQVKRALAALQPFCDLEGSAQLHRVVLQRLPLKPRPTARSVEDHRVYSLSQDSDTRGRGGRLCLLKPALPAHMFQPDVDLVTRIDEALKTTRNIGIVGSMGSGKTTIAAAVLERVASRFDAALWLTVAENSFPQELSSAAWELFPDVSSQQRWFSCASEGTKYISERLVREGRSVLLVLDDVTRVGSADAAAVEALNFATRPGACVDGSRLIITARDREALDLLQLHSSSDACSAGPLTQLHVFKSSCLDKVAAKEMLYYHAFGASAATPPSHVPPETCTQLLHGCGASPFALRVLGNSLRHCASSDEWESVRAAVQRPRVRSCHATVRACAGSIAVLPPSLQRCLPVLAALSCGNMVEAEVVHACAALAPLYTPASVQAATRKVQQLVRRGLLCVRSARTRRIYYMHDAVRESLRVLGWTCPPAPKQLRSRRNSFVSGGNAAIMRAQIVPLAHAKPRRTRPSIPAWFVRHDVSNLAWCVIGSCLPEPMAQRVRATRGLGATEMSMLDCLAGSVHLDLSGCEHLVQLPESVGRREAMGRLTLSGCTRLAHLPEGIGSCLRLIHIDLSSCSRLPKLPESIGGCIGLEELNLQQCSSLAQLPESIGGCSQLADLNLQGCSSLAQLPASLGGCSRLQALDLSHCEQLASLQESIGGLTRMTHLSLNRCGRLVQVPGSIGKCAKLRYLDCSHCSNLAQLPDSITRCTRLEGLSLMQCKALEQLPQSLGSLPKLSSLHLHGCPAIFSHLGLPAKLAAAAVVPASSDSPPFGRVTAEWSHELTIEFMGSDANRVLGDTAAERVIKAHMRR